MKITRSKIGLTVLIFFVFIIGALSGLMTSSYLYYRHVFSQMADETAGILSERINTLCQLRLGEIDNAIEQLESSVDMSIISITQTPHIRQTDLRFRVLRGAKTYKELYPSKSQVASKVTEALRDIPKIETFKCDSSLCRLVTQTAEEKSKSTRQSPLTPAGQ